ncbi:MAG: ABC transporter substrate-binding protein [Aulosira sp. DedQUE10]|nr:ABC transporter substrate-binding protein [Aulosira sp. DedQUE10]
MQKIKEHFSPIAIAAAVMVFSAISVKVIENNTLSVSNNNLQNNTVTPEAPPSVIPEVTPAATPETTPTLTPSNPSSETYLGDRLSFGEKILVKQEEAGTPNQDFQAAKNRGSEAIAAGNYEQAAIEFEAAIQIYRNAPETLIYLNNARVATQSPYTIAVVIPYGSDVTGALEILRGVAQAQNEINQSGGINGIPLKILIVNDDDNPKMSKQIASELVNNSEVIGVVGHFSSGATLAAGEEYNIGKLVVISPVSTAVKLTDFSPYVFRTVPNDAIAAKKLAKHMITKLKKQKAAVFFNSQSTYSLSLRSQFVQEVLANGGQVDKDVEFDMSAPGFSAIQSVEKAKVKGTQVLMLAANTGMLDKALLVIQASQKRFSLLGGDDVYAPTILKRGGEAAVGLAVAVAWHIDGNPGTQFSSKSQQLWQGKVNWRTATSYDAAKALIAAIERGSTRSGVQQALSAQDFSASGASGVVKFLTSGDRNGSIQLVEVRPSKSSGTYDFVPLR